jgi:PAS domain S-box-containing protein
LGRCDAQILIVDDNVANLIALEAALGSEGFELVRAASGEQAIHCVRLAEYACILLDVQMPGMDGFETARRIRQVEKPRHTPIIFLTANFPSEKDALHGYEVGAVDYLAKPLNMDVVRAKVAVFVELLLTHRENRRQAEENRRQAEENRRQAELLAEWERKEAARAKLASERRYQHLVEGIRDGIVWAVDLDLQRFSFASRYAERITGHPPEAWLGEPEFLAKHLFPDDRERVLAAFAVSRATLEPFSLEHRFVKADGTSVWFHTSVHADADEHGVPEFRGLSVDITHLKEVEERLRAAVRTRDEFLSIASHELRTPITPLQLQMQGFVRFIEAERYDLLSFEDLRDMLKLSGSQVARLGRLIGQILEISRIDIGRFKLDTRPTDLAEIVRDVVRQFYYEIQASHSDVTLHLDADVRAEVDPLRFEQVVVNLLSNSLKYGNRKPIDIYLRRRPAVVELVVEDQGLGIAKQDHARIFQRFERAVSERHYGGLGLGLFITAEIVSLHQGRLWVDSELGQGAAFHVEFPVEQPSARPGVAAKPEQPSPSTRH